MYARGVLANGKSVEHLWSKTWGPPFFRDAMARDQFKEIMKCLRFDLKSTRSQRLKDDKFALAFHVWDKFIENYIACYRPNDNITIDEQLFPTKARCPFTQYIASKPDKFGIKFWLAADTTSKYLVNSSPYLGKDETRPSNLSVGEYVVLRLMEQYLGTGRNVTTDNFSTSMKLAESIESKKTTLVNRNGKEIPVAVKSFRAPRYSTTVLKHNNSILTVCQGKLSKNLLLLSSMHNSVAIEDGIKKLPEKVSFYNSTKYGVDVLDQMGRVYSRKAHSGRWPVQFFL
jgi:hypothetical protein